MKVYTIMNKYRQTVHLGKGTLKCDYNHNKVKIKRNFKKRLDK